MSINELFQTNNTTISAGTRGLPGTAELTTLAGNHAHYIIKSMEGDIDNYRDKIQQSAKDAAALDALIEELSPDFDENETAFLLELDDAVIDGILKSQQSKRSRAKSKAMTLDNYYTLLTAAIAEKLIRQVTGRTKAAMIRHGNIVDFTGAQLEALAEDQEALRREIRNLQSKKSIMKSKADFDETSEAWQALLKAEQQLKDLRVGGRHASVVEVDTTKDALNAKLADVNLDELDPADAQALLKSINEMIKG